MGNNIAQSDPAEGSREVIERELARQDARNGDKKAAEQTRPASKHEGKRGRTKN
jgi:hypothetical protein